MSASLFDPFIIGRHRFKNRIFSTGHMTVMLEDGFPSDAMVAYHSARAKGGASLIIIEAARPHISGISSRPSIHAFDDRCIPGYRRLAEVCHAEDCRIFGQLTHPGREMGLAADGTHSLSFAPSAVPNERFHVMPREMPISMIDSIVSGFAASTARMRVAGLDGVEIIGCQGYLLAQFMNPRVNQRKDVYGGSFENRLRFVRQVIEATRRGAGPDMLIGIRLSGDELEHDGLEAGEVIAVAKALEADGALDYLNVTAGSSAGLAGSVHIVPPMAIETGYTAPFAAVIKAETKLPVFVAGRINQPQIAETILKTGQADMCGMTRAMISDPEMPKKAQAGNFDDIRACVACNQACIGHMLNGFPISCIQRPETGRELQYGTLRDADSYKNVLVVGGGPAGMKAAAVAAQRGHNVTLHEASPVLGGQVNLAQMLPGRAEFGGITTNLAREMEQAGVTVHLNSKIGPDDVKAANPDEVILATGATERRPALEDCEDAHVVTAWEVIKGTANVGSRVVIADWRCDWIGLGIAEKLARNGCHVQLAVNGTTAGQTIPQYARDKWLGELHKLGVEILPYSRLFGADETTVYLQHTLSGEPMMCEDTDTLVTALGHQPVDDLADALSSWPGNVHSIGDCLAARTVEEAVLEGLKLTARL